MADTVIAEECVKVAKCDLVAAWTILENLAVSLDQIGGTWGDEDGAYNQCAAREALDAYLTPEVVKAINDARMRLGQYLSDDEAEALSERIAYWNYAGVGKVASGTR